MITSFIIHLYRERFAFVTFVLSLLAFTAKGQKINATGPSVSGWDRATTWV